MAVNFLVALRVTEFVSAPLRRAAEAGNMMTDAADRMSVQIRTANQALLGMATVAGAAAVATSVSAATLEDAMARLQTVTESSTQSVTTSLAEAEKAARQFSTQYSASASEVIKAQFEIATAGIRVEEQIAATQSSFKLARATMGDFTQAAQMMGSFLNTFGKNAEFNYLEPAEKMEKITDRLATAVQKFQVTLPVLAESFKFIVGPASTLELKLSEVTAALGILNTAGFRGTLAGTALSNVFNKLDKAIEKLDLNPDKFIDLNGELKDLASFMDEVNKALANKTPIEQQNILIDTFDIRAGRVFKTLLNNVDALRRFTNELEVTSGATEKMNAIIENTTSAKLKQFSNSLQNIATIIGKEFNNALKFAADFLKSFAVGIESFVGAHSTLVASFVALTVILPLGIAGLVTYGAVVGRVTTALTAMAASQAAVTATAGKIGLGAALAFRWVAIVAGAAALLYGIVSALSALKDVIFGVSDASEQLTIKWSDLDSLFGNSIQRVSRLASELDRLGKIVEHNVKIPLGDRSLGTLPFAVQATQALQKDPAKTMKQAIEEAAKSAGGFEGIMRQLELAMSMTLESSGVGIAKMGDNFRKMMMEADRSFASLSDVSQVAQAAMDVRDSFELATKAIAAGSDQGTEAIGKLLRVYDELSNAGSRMSDDQLIDRYKKLFETIESSQNGLLLSTNSGVEKVRKAFLDLGMSAETIAEKLEDLDSSGGSFASRIADPKIQEAIAKIKFGIVETANSIRSLTPVAQTLSLLLQGMEIPTAQLRRSTASVKNLFKNAELGAGLYANAIAEAPKRIKEAEHNLKVFQAFAERGREFITLTPPELQITEQFKKLKEQVEKSEDITLELQLMISASKEELALKRVFGIIEKIKGKMTEQQGLDLLKLGDAFGSAISSAFGEKLTGKDLFKGLSVAFNQQFIGSIQRDLGLFLSTQFSDEMRSAINMASDIIKQAALGGKLMDGLQSGSLVKQINDELHRALPNLKKITGGDIFELGKDNKLADDFNKIFTDASVKLVTADNQTFAKLGELQNILAGGPGETLQQITAQATQLRDLLVRAANAGANDAIRPIEEALSAALSRMRQDGGNSLVQQMTSASQQFTTAGNGVVSGLASVIGSFVPAGERFVHVVAEGIKQAISTISSAGGQSVGAGKTMNIVIEQGARKLDISLNGNIQTPGLDEHDIKSIIKEARTEMLAEMEETIRKLEDRLRGR